MRVIVAAQCRRHGRHLRSVHRTVYYENIRVRQVERNVSDFVAQPAARPDSVGAGDSRRAVFRSVYGAFVVCRADSYRKVFDFLGIVVEAQRDSRGVVPVFGNRNRSRACALNRNIFENRPARVCVFRHNRELAQRAAQALVNAHREGVGHIHVGGDVVAGYVVEVFRAA